MSDPIQVYSNDSGPIPPRNCGHGLIWAYIAYRDAENDYNLYGYGDTPEDAIADFCRNEAEAHCAACTNDCRSDEDCILTSGNLSFYTKRQLAIFMGGAQVMLHTHNPPGATFYKGLLWVPTDPRRYTFDMLGFIPGFLSADDPRPAVKQIASAYIGGWFPFKGFKLLQNGDLKYPDDPPTKLLYRSFLREESLFFYQHAWFRIEQPDGGWEVARLD